MGLVIKIDYCYDWQPTYFVQCLDEELAKKKAFNAFKQTTTCNLPDTLEEAMKDSDFYIVL